MKVGAMRARRNLPALFLGAALSIGNSAALGEQAQPAPQQPPQQPQQAQPKIVFGAKDIQLAPAGTYSIDPNHTAVVARVSHVGYSYSVFRFGTVAGTLVWDPSNVAQARLSANVQTASIETPVQGFAEQLAGDEYLKSAAFPQANFISTAFRQKDATHGEVDGAFTLMGITRPMTFEVTLVGAGPGFFGHPRIGIHAESAINPQDYGFPAVFGDRIDLVIDGEFQRN